MAAISFMGMSGGFGPPHHERGVAEPGGGGNSSMKCPDVCV